MTVIIIYIVLIMLLLVGIRSNEDGNELLSKKNTNALKGIFCIVVVLSHLNDCSPYLYIIQLVFVCVFCFFLFSGYGLTISLLEYDICNSTRKKFFLKQVKRCMKLIIPLGVVYIFERKLNLTLLSGGANGLLLFR